jgi:hypothetical protein
MEVTLKLFSLSKASLFKKISFFSPLTIHHKFYIQHIFSIIRNKGIHN